MSKKKEKEERGDHGMRLQLQQHQCKNSLTTL